jgi:DNA-binding CsgD family transcriptional regulator
MDTGTRDALVGSIYESGLIPAHWSTTLAQLKDALGFRYAALAHQALPGERPLVDVTVGIEGDYLKRVAHYAPDYIARWGGAEAVARLPLGEPAILSRVNPPARWQRTAWWREWAQPQGVTDVMALGLARDRRQVGSIIFGQHVSQGPLTLATAQAARPLLNHLQRAVVIGRAVAPNGASCAMLELALDCLDLPVLLLGPGLRLVQANRAAQGLLNAGALRTDAHGRLRLGGLAPAEATAAVDGLFPGGWPLAALPAGWVAGRTGMLGRAGDGATVRAFAGADVALLLAPRAGRPPPASALARLFGLEPGPAAALAAQLWPPRDTPSAAPAPPPAPVARAACDTLAQRYRLTPAEAAVAVEVARGDGRAAAARRLGVRPTTVRAHLSAIFAKTGVSRQAELAALFAERG